jgi:hypothetical protein
MPGQSTGVLQNRDENVEGARASCFFAEACKVYAISRASPVDRPNAECSCQTAV